MLNKLQTSTFKTLNHYKIVNNFKKTTQNLSNVNYNKINNQNQNSFKINNNNSNNSIYNNINCLKRFFTTRLPIEKIRNVAIIAHVDHGKTTLVDCLLRQTNAIKSSEEKVRVMDSKALEQERGITILAKVTSVIWNDHRFNIVDTPGHGDFGGEVERVLDMVDGVVLVVDATEGPMTQTKYVLTKALSHNLKPVVVINKMDRETARPNEVETEIFDLFVALNATDEQLEYPTLFAAAREGWISFNKQDKKKGAFSLLQAIIDHVPKPQVNLNDPFSMIAVMIEYDNFMGRILTGKLLTGSITVGQKVRGISRNGNIIEEAIVTKILAASGLTKEIQDSAQAGEIVSIAGLSQTSVADTVCDLSVTEALKVTPIDPPVLEMTFSPNDSPIAGTEGTLLNSSHIKGRLTKELENNPALTITFSGDSTYEVAGRGELHLGILIEEMRREGYELSISPPRILLKIVDGKKMEPLEEVFIDVESKYTGMIIERLTLRGAELREIKSDDDTLFSKLIFLCPSRGLIGLRSILSNETKGTAVINHSFHSLIPYKGKLSASDKGALISLNTGKVTTYALNTLESRGILFVTPQTKVYTGMIIGEHSRENDLDVNPIKEKALTNIRSANKEEGIRLTPAKIITLEEAIARVKEDEMIEVTPKSVRLRKRILDPSARKSFQRKSED
eukprot:TRINITY_DN1143_c1_g2_i1.p1 TRINITY_DN1143_c1_g2~~TRINITY_DN1143_c1_g2_i1.p1  ORF type:complete len:677 (-),score=302.82 TRINITY_DN1143_c1_g2_i1:50-2080(-)